MWDARGGGTVGGRGGGTRWNSMVAWCPGVAVRRMGGGATGARFGMRAGIREGEDGAAAEAAGGVIAVVVVVVVVVPVVRLCRCTCVHTHLAQLALVAQQLELGREHEEALAGAMRRGRNAGAMSQLRCRRVASSTTPTHPVSLWPAYRPPPRRKRRGGKRREGRGRARARASGRRHRLMLRPDSAARMHLLVGGEEGRGVLVLGAPAEAQERHMALPPPRDALPWGARESLARARRVRGRAVRRGEALRCLSVRTQGDGERYARAMASGRPQTNISPLLDSRARGPARGARWPARRAAARVAAGSAAATRA